MPSSAPTETIVIKRIFNTSQTTLFSAFSDPQIIEQWLSPADDISLNVKLFEFHPTGNYTYTYILPDGTNAVLRGNFITIDKPSQLSFTWQWEAPDPHAGILSHVTLLFKPLVMIEENMRTELTITHIKLSADSMSIRHDQGWHGSLIRLEKYLFNIRKHIQ